MKVNRCRHAVRLAPVFLAFLALIFVALTAPPSASGEEILAVARDGVMLRAVPGIHGKALWRYDQGLPLKIIGAQGDWRRVRDFDGDGGWLLLSDLNQEPHMVVCAKTSSGEQVEANIFNGPGEEYQMVGKAAYGAVFSTL